MYRCVQRVFRENIHEVWYRCMRDRYSANKDRRNPPCCALTCVPQEPNGASVQRPIENHTRAHLRVHKSTQRAPASYRPRKLRMWLPMIAKDAIPIPKSAHCAQNTPQMYEIIAIRLNYKTGVLLCQADSVLQIQMVLRARICKFMHTLQAQAILMCFSE